MKNLIIPIVLILGVLFQHTGRAQDFFKSSLNPPEGRITDIHIVSPDIIYAGGEFGLLLKSTDSGIKWELQISNYKYMVNDLHFIDENTGFAAMENSVILKTTSGGATWFTVYLPVGNKKVTKIKSHGANLYASCSGGQIYKSSDLGQSWGLFAWPVENSIEDFLITGDFPGVFITKSGEVYTSGDGAGWFLKFEGLHFSLNSLVSLSANTFLAGGGGGRTFRSTDGGETWVSGSTGSANTIIQFNFYSTTSGFAVSDSGEVYHTSNQGLNWNIYPLPSGLRARSIGFLNPGKLYFGGFEGNISIYTAATSSWYYYEGFSNYNIYSVTTPGIHGMYAASDSGRIYYSQYGKDWILYRTPLTVNLRTIHAIGDTMAWAAGDSGYVCRRVAATGIWETYHTGVSTDISSIFGISFNHAIAVGKSGLILVTTDGGTTWVQVTSPVSVNLNSVFFLNKTIGLIAGNGGVILRSTDGGFSWSAVPSGVTVNLTSVSSESYPWAAAAGDSGTVLTTGNHGQTWSKKNLNPAVMHNFNSICFGNQQTMYVLSGRGKIYRIPYLTSTIAVIYENTDSLFLSGIAARGVGSITVGAYNNTALRHYTNFLIPVELLSFSAKNIDGKILLNWNTATETNNRGFEVQKSINNKDWFDIGFVTGSGTATEPAIYTFTDNYPSRGIMYYRLRQIDYDGRAEILRQIEVPFESSYELEQNYPNPFNPATEISYSIPFAGKVSLIVYDALGREVEVLVNKLQEPGRYTVSFDGSSHASGIYYTKLTAGSYVMTRKMILLK